MRRRLISLAIALSRCVSRSLSVLEPDSGRPLHLGLLSSASLSVYASLVVSMDGTIARSVGSAGGSGPPPCSANTVVSLATLRNAGFSFVRSNDSSADDEDPAERISLPR